MEAKLTQQEINKADRVLRTRGEYLELLFNKQNIKQVHSYIPVIKYEDQMALKAKESQQNIFANLIIQSTYLIYNAHWHKIPIKIDEIDIVINVKDLKIKDPMRAYILYSIESCKYKVTEHIRNIIGWILEKIQYFGKPKFADDSLIKNFKVHWKCIKEFTTEKTEDIGQLMKFLEETELFRVHSRLLRIKNLSIINLLKTNSTLFKRLKEAVRNQRQAIQESNNLSKDAQDEQIWQAESNIYDAVRPFFTEYMKEFASVDDQSEVADEQEEQCMRVGVHYGEGQFAFCKVIRHHVKTSNKRYPTYIDEPEIIYEPNNAKFQLEYSAYRNYMSVELITDIVLDLDISDYLMNQNMKLGFDSATISFLIMDTKYNKKARHLTFKTYCTFLKKSKVLEKLLLQMDILVVAYVIYDPYFRRDSKQFRQDLQSSNIHAKAYHYMEIVLQIINKTYQQLQVEQ